MKREEEREERKKEKKENVYDLGIQIEYKSQKEKKRIFCTLLPLHNNINNLKRGVNLKSKAMNFFIFFVWCKIC